MKTRNNSEDFIQKIFERSEDPISELEKINSIIPMFFTDKQNIVDANKRLESYGYQINDEYIEEIIEQIQMFGHPACGSSIGGYGSGHPSCGIGSGSYGGHPACGTNRGGYGSGHPACGIGSGNYGRHPSCCSTNERGKSLLLIRTYNNDSCNEIRN